jgi:uncharacterized protein YndB with AHSA1/START domain
MKTALQFDFIVDKQNNSITVKREFAGDRQLVWDCYTKSELLDQWWAPSPFTTKTKSMDFREGGHWLYCMLDPEGKKYWGRMDYTKVNAIDSYEALDAFCDENGEINTQLPRAPWDARFSDAGENTLVVTKVTYKSLADLEAVINMGMQEGLTSALENLDALIAKLAK